MAELKFNDLHALGGHAKAAIRYHLKTGHSPPWLREQTLAQRIPWSLAEQSIPYGRF